MGRVSHGIGHLRCGDRSADVRPRLGWWCGGSGGPEGAGVVVRAVVLRSKTVTNSTLFRRRCCPDESSGARDRFSSHPRVSNRSASPLARRLSMRISRRSSRKNHRLSVNVPVGSEWRRSSKRTPSRRLASSPSPTRRRGGAQSAQNNVQGHVRARFTRRRGPVFPRVNRGVLRRRARHRGASPCHEHAPHPRRRSLTPERTAKTASAVDPPTHRSSSRRRHPKAPPGQGRPSRPGTLSPTIPHPSPPRDRRARDARSTRNRLLHRRPEKPL